MLLTVYLILFCIRLLFLSAGLIIWFGNSKFRKKKEDEDDPPLPPLSLIIAARNEEENLRKHLPLWLDQNHPDFELIIVNDRSSDDSEAFLKDFEKAVPGKLRIINIRKKPEKADGKKHALLRGIEAASHDVLVFTDADCRPASPNWLIRMSKPFAKAQTEVLLGFSDYEKTPENRLLNTLIRFETLHTALQYFSFACINLPYMGVGRNLAYRKSVFEKHGGFSEIEEISGGDDDLTVQRLANKKNTAFTLHPESLTISVPPRRWKEWFRQKTRHLSAGKYYRPFFTLTLGIYMFSALLTILAAPYFLFQQAIIILVFFVLKFAAEFLLFIRIGRITKRSYRYALFPIAEILYFSFYLLFATAALFRRKNSTWQ